MSSIEIICLEKPAFYALVKEVVNQLKQENNITEQEFISGEMAMKKLGTGRTTFLKLRDEGKFKFKQVTPRIYMYETASLDAYLRDKNKSGK